MQDERSSKTITPATHARGWNGTRRRWFMPSPSAAQMQPPGPPSQAEGPINPMQPDLTHLCGARTRKGTQQLPRDGKASLSVMHGGSPGSGAPEGQRNGNWRAAVTAAPGAKEWILRERERQEREREWSKKAKKMPPAVVSAGFVRREVCKRSRSPSTP